MTQVGTYQNPTWGWATWKRAWQHYDIAAKIWERFRNTSWVQGIVEDPMAARYWTDMFEAAYRSGGEIDFWDYQWTLACWAQNGLSIIPCSNLVSNIGFGREATHTFVKEGDKRADMQVSPMMFPLRHPEVVRVDLLADRAIIEETVLPNLLLHDNYRSWFGKQWAALVRERPSFKNPRALLRRLRMIK